MHHHPFDYKPGMQLKDSDELKTVIENRIDVLLFGHYHKDPASAGKSIMACGESQDATMPVLQPTKTGIPDFKESLIFLILIPEWIMMGISSEIKAEID